jgi:allantoinase
MADFDPHKLFAFTPIVDRKPITWPNGAHIAVWVVPNVESYHIDVAQQGPAPDIRNYSRRSYGNRVGVWRLMETDRWR